MLHSSRLSSSVDIKDMIHDSSTHSNLVYIYGLSLHMTPRFQAVSNVGDAVSLYSCMSGRASSKAPEQSWNLQGRNALLSYGMEVKLRERG
jgi:hypothetical protein